MSDLGIMLRSMEVISENIKCKKPYEGALRRLKKASLCGFEPHEIVSNNSENMKNFVRGKKRSNRW